MNNRKNILHLFDELPEIKASGNWEQSLFSAWEFKKHERKMVRTGKILLAVTVILIVVNVATHLSLNSQQSVSPEFSGKSEMEYVADNFLITGNH